MIVRDEEKRLGHALENASIFADEIIIVDTGSTDKTVSFAKKYTDKIYSYDWNDDFASARNFSFEKAENEYIMWLDGDDLVPIESAKAIKEWKKAEGDVDVLMCPYVADYDENLTPTFSYLRERIVKNSKAFRWHERVHEVITPSGIIVTNHDIKIYHGKYRKERSQRNLRIYKKMIEEGELLSPRAQFYYSRELYFNNLIDEAIHEFSRFLADGKGWSENNIEACLDIGKCYKIKKKYANSLTALYGSFVYDLPRGEVLYEIGNVYFEQCEYRKAIYWYKLALDMSPQIENGGFINMDTVTFLPALQLCVCYDKLGQIALARHYHEVSKGFKPNDQAVQNNQEYFDNLSKNT